MLVALLTNYRRFVDSCRSAWSYLAGPRKVPSLVALTTVESDFPHSGNWPKTFLRVSHGKSVVRAMLLADYDRWKALRTRAEGRGAYEAAKERIGAEVAALVEAHYPEARGKVEVVDVATPTTYERHSNAWRGTWMAWANTPGAKIRGVPVTLPGLTHFYQAGQWLLLPGGLPVAVVTGKWAIQHVCRAERVRFQP